jgi:UPF0176 protein
LKWAPAAAYNDATMPVLNIAAYRFVRLEQPEQLQTALHQTLEQLALKGTVLLAEEGINLFLAGAAPSIYLFLAGLRQDSRFAGLEVKESWSQAQPFRKLLVKVKNEIIRMDHPAIQPGQSRAPAVDGATLKRWLDAGHDDNGRPVVTLDTRNTYETDVGSFRGAIDWRIDKFTEFPQALRQHGAQLDGKTVVSFCTGGIRCEKAALFMREAGINHVYQLDGGILKYFENIGQTHFDGQCFVFDERRALDTQLQARVDAAAPKEQPPRAKPSRTAPA